MIVLARIRQSEHSFPPIFMTNSYRSGKGRKSAKSGNQSRNASGKRRPPRGGGFKPSTLDPELLIQKVPTKEQVAYVSERKIVDLPVHETLVKLLLDKGFERPSEIQDKSIEALLKGKDLLGIAKTGTGKTAAFLIPIIHGLLHTKKLTSALVLVPTRELALQVEDEFKSMSRNTGLKNACFIGGTNINTDLRKARQRINLIVATPGRLLDLHSRGALRLNFIETLVLDEFDRMLDMGFVHDVKKLLGYLNNRKQTMLFSATLDKKQESLIAEILKKPVRVQVASGQSTSENVAQSLIRLKPEDNKLAVLKDILRKPDVEKVILFEETKHKVNKLCRLLVKAGFKAEAIHGNKSQSARVAALEGFRKGELQILVASDVASRGIDVVDVTHVINYQIPQTYDTYIHRIGRTGRSGKKGVAITFVDPK